MCVRGVVDKCVHRTGPVFDPPRWALVWRQWCGAADGGASDGGGNSLHRLGRSLRGYDSSLTLLDIAPFDHPEADRIDAIDESPDDLQSFGYDTPSTFIRPRRVRHSAGRKPAPTATKATEAASPAPFIHLESVISDKTHSVGTGFAACPVAS